MSNPYTTEVLTELKRRSIHAINIYEPTTHPEHNQLSLHKSTCKYRLGFGGNQSGKSHMAAFEIACWARGNHPYRSIPEGSIEIWVLSAEYVTIRTGIYRHLLDILPDWDIVERGPNVPGHRLPTFIAVRRLNAEGIESVCTITFMSCKGENRQKFQAAAVDLISIDEEIPEEIWEEIQARTLATGGEFIISATLVESYDWILKLEQRAEEKDPRVFLTRLNTAFNPYINAEALEELTEQWSDETKEYRLYGRSRRSTGLVYNNWTNERNVIKPFTIPEDWPRYNSIDPGIRTTAVLWIAVGPNQRQYVYRELYLHNEPLYEVARAIKRCEGWILNKELSNSFKHFVWERSDIEPERIYLRVIDPSSQRRSEAGDDPILIRLGNLYGINCIPADNQKQAGIESCRFCLDDLEDGLPGLQVFDTCINFIEERRRYRIRSTVNKKDRNDTIDEPIKSKDHLMDAWRYIEMTCSPKWEDREEYEISRSKSFSASEFISNRSKARDNYVHEFCGSEW